MYTTNRNLKVYDLPGCWILRSTSFVLTSQTTCCEGGILVVRNDATETLQQSKSTPYMRSSPKDRRRTFNKAAASLQDTVILEGRSWVFKNSETRRGGGTAASHRSNQALYQYALQLSWAPVKVKQDADNAAFATSDPDTTAICGQ